MPNRYHKDLYYCGSLFSIWNFDHLPEVDIVVIRCSQISVSIKKGSRKNSGEIVTRSLEARLIDAWGSHNVARIAEEIKVFIVAKQWLDSNRQFSD